MSPCDRPLALAHVSAAPAHRPARHPDDDPRCASIGARRMRCATAPLRCIWRARRWHSSAQEERASCRPAVTNKWCAAEGGGGALHVRFQARVAQELALADEGEQGGSSSAAADADGGPYATSITSELIKEQPPAEQPPAATPPDEVQTSVAPQLAVKKRKLSETSGARRSATYNKERRLKMLDVGREELRT
eukprot:7377489-Prymnesium_polylepis.1